LQGIVAERGLQKEGCMMKVAAVMVAAVKIAAVVV
jgi:hypothetical protein